MASITTTTTPCRPRAGRFAALSAVAAAWLVLAAIALATAPAVHAAPPPASLSAGQIRVHYIDIGQGDAILIQSAKNAVLIDGGEYKARDVLTAYLKKVGIGTLDYVVATHPHSDHIGGLGTVISQFGVKNVIMPDVTNNTKTFIKLLETIENKGLSITVPKVGDKLAAGIISFVVLGPIGDAEPNLNNMSIVLRMAHGSTSFLFTGDAEAQLEMKILGRGLNVQSDVLKAGHHGSRTSTSVKFLDAVRPSIVVVSCGYQNSYGHPHDQFMRRMEVPERKITLYRTDMQGSVVITTDGKNINTYTTGVAGRPSSTTR